MTFDTKAAQRKMAELCFTRAHANAFLDPSGKPYKASRSKLDDMCLEVCIGYEAALIDAGFIDTFSPFVALVVSTRGWDGVMEAFKEKTNATEG